MTPERVAMYSPMADKQKGKHMHMHTYHIHNIPHALINILLILYTIIHTHTSS